MKVILLKELQGKGGEGDVIDVNRGFANNFLLTQGYAVKATPGNLKQLEERKKNIAKREETRIADANALAEKLNDATVRVIAQVGEEGVLFGSVTAPLVADAIAEQLDIEIDRRRVELGKPIKMTGTYQVPVRHQGHGDRDRCWRVRGRRGHRRYRRGYRYRRDSGRRDG